MDDVGVEAGAQHQREAAWPRRRRPEAEVEAPRAARRDDAGQADRIVGQRERAGEQVLVAERENGQRDVGRQLVDHRGDRAVAAGGDDAADASERRRIAEQGGALGRLPHHAHIAPGRRQRRRQRLHTRARPRRAPIRIRRDEDHAPAR